MAAAPLVPPQPAHAKAQLMPPPAELTARPQSTEAAARTPRSMRKTQAEAKPAKALQLAMPLMIHQMAHHPTQHQSTNLKETLPLRSLQIPHHPTTEITP